jgi:hypothetical protein
VDDPWTTRRRPQRPLDERRGTIRVIASNACRRSRRTITNSSLCRDRERRNFPFTRCASMSALIPTRVIRTAADRLPRREQILAPTRPQSSCPATTGLMPSIQREGKSKQYAISCHLVRNIVGPSARLRCFIATADSRPCLRSASAAIHNREETQRLLATYVGARAGDRILNGSIKRGDCETINAVLWICDLENFTAV